MGIGNILIVVGVLHPIPILVLEFRKHMVIYNKEEEWNIKE